MKKKEKYLTKKDESLKESMDKIKKVCLNDTKWLEYEATGKIHKDELNLYKKQKIGGKCKECGKDWKLIKYSNTYGEDQYFLPDCDCYPKCEWCGRFMIVEKVHGLPGCMDCNYNINTNSWQLMPCIEWVDASAYDERGKKIKGKRKKCGGMITLKFNGRYSCTKCGKNYETTRFEV